MKLRRILLLGMLGFSLALSAENKKIGYVQVSPDSSLADAVRKAREMRRLGQADSVVVKMQAGQYRLYELWCSVRKTVISVLRERLR